jgi:hypothetical protein
MHMAIYFSCVSNVDALKLHRKGHSIVYMATSRVYTFVHHRLVPYERCKPSYFTDHREPSKKGNNRGRRQRSNPS